MKKGGMISMLSLAFLLTGIENVKAENTVFDDSASFTVARAVSLGRSVTLSGNKKSTVADLSSQTGGGGTGNTVSKKCTAHCAKNACDTKTGICTACVAGYTLNGNVCEKNPDTPNTTSNDDTECLRLCGTGFVYDRPGAKNGGQERVCTRYKLPCGYGCTTGWDFRYLVNGTNYTCQDARQTEDKDAMCRQICDYVDEGHGSEYYYERPGALSTPEMGQERVCTRYPLSCGYACTTGWDIKQLVVNKKNGLQTNYTCQKAEQNSDESECIRLCGKDFHYDRPGDKNGGAEKVCTKYPKSCGYGCTTGWDIDYLVQGTNYTCQTAIQKVACTNKYFKNSDGSITVPSGYDCVDLYGHTATISIPKSTYGEVNIRMWGSATVNGEFTTTTLQSLYNTGGISGNGNVITFNNRVTAYEVKLDESKDSKAGDRKGTKMIFNGGLSGNPTCTVVAGLTNSYYTPKETSATCTCTNNVCKINN